jgi:predicted RNA-binding protein with RPS1 domain
VIPFRNLSYFLYLGIIVKIESFGAFVEMTGSRFQGLVNEIH